MKKATATSQGNSRLLAALGEKRPVEWSGVMERLMGAFEIMLAGIVVLDVNPLGD
jgi:hypothetical protein